MKYKWTVFNEFRLSLSLMQISWKRERKKDVELFVEVGVKCLKQLQELYNDLLFLIKRMDIKDLFDIYKKFR